MVKPLTILMVAAENDALKGGKVGGIGDVVRDVPPELAEQGCKVLVVTPSYGFLHDLPGAKPVGSVTFRFSGVYDQADIYQVPGKEPHDNVVNLVIDHPAFVAQERGRYQIYVNDSSENPFATDATKYALFCLAVAEAIKENLFGSLDVLHLHDWHAAFLLILRQYHKVYRTLRGIRAVYTIHNLALQGVRPFLGSDSSLSAWYPGLEYDWDVLADPRWPDAVNPMAVGIRLADMVHTVSPSYAEEILQPSDEPRYYGGEGLEMDLRAARNQGRLIGILNGCEYPPDRVPEQLEFPSLIRLLRSEVLSWAAGQPNLATAHFLAYNRLNELAARPERPQTILASVSRTVEQKLFLMTEPGSQVASGLAGILQGLGTEGTYILLGAGNPRYERFLTEMTALFDNFVFLNGYSDRVARALYANGDLFLMPSSFEPCGISQMLAMRDGQPCLVHAVGGLRDTVNDGVNGFAFDGHTLKEQVDHFVNRTMEAVRLRESDPDRWPQIRDAASAARFLWSDSVRQYIDRLYRPRLTLAKRAG